MSHPAPARPWQKVGVDIFAFDGREYLLTVDYLSGFFEVDRLQTKSVADIVYCLRQHFARHGLPDTVISDNSPFNSAEFKRFAAKYDFTHVTSSPRYPQSNGKVENAIKTMKRLMVKASQENSDPLLALLDWRNTPSEQLGVSPAQILLGRRTRTTLPTTNKLLDTPLAAEAQQALQRAKQKQAQYYDRHTKDRPTLPIGKTVRFRYDDKENGWRKGEVIRALPHRSYVVRAQDGTFYRRTSRHVRESAESPLVFEDDEFVEDTLQETSSGQQNVHNSHPEPAAPTTTTTTMNGGATSRRPADGGPVVTRSGRTVNRPARYRQH
jgi:hypothetical protein